MANNLFLLNLLYNYPADAATGRFSDSLAPPGQSSNGIDLTQVSKVWLNAPIAPGKSFNPYDAGIVWTEVGTDGSLLVSSDPSLNCNIAVNIVPVNPPAPGTTVKVTLTVGRVPRALQKFVSPFQVGNGSCNANAVFDFGFACANVPAAAPISWAYVLGPILNGPPPNTLWVAHHYSFIASITVQTPNAPDATFSHDPEMDVSC
jgi:hypothetical protein